MDLFSGIWLGTRFTATAGLTGSSTGWRIFRLRRRGRAAKVRNECTKRSSDRSERNSSNASVWFAGTCTYVHIYFHFKWFVRCDSHYTFLGLDGEWFRRAWFLILKKTWKIVHMPVKACTYIHRPDPFMSNVSFIFIWQGYPELYLYLRQWKSRAKIHWTCTS
jgi:hypothetical protein